MASASNIRNSATEPRKTGSRLCAAVAVAVVGAVVVVAVQATISEQNTAPTPQKKFSRLTALALELARELGCEPEPDPISAISKLSDGTISPRPRPYAATDASPSPSDPMVSVATPHAIKSSPDKNAGRNPQRASRTPESCTPTSDARNCTRKRLPA
jgi:hypothetical protein